MLNKTEILLLLSSKGFSPYLSVNNSALLLLIRCDLTGVSEIVMVLTEFGF